jgi:hypothetical protein
MAPAKSRFCPIATEPDCRLVDERRIADWPLEIGIHQIMTTRTLLKRLEKVEEALKAQSIFSQDCICFPEKEQPFFCSPSEEPVAAKVKCPLHGNGSISPSFTYTSRSGEGRKSRPADRGSALSTGRRGRPVSRPSCGLPFRKKRQRTGKSFSGSRTEQSSGLVTARNKVPSLFRRHKGESAMDKTVLVFRRRVHAHSTRLASKQHSSRRLPGSSGRATWPSGSLVFHFAPI